MKIWVIIHHEMIDGVDHLIVHGNTEHKPFASKEDAEEHIGMGNFPANAQAVHMDWNGPIDQFIPYVYKRVQ